LGEKYQKKKKSNSRDKFITFSGCDTELKHLIDINGERSDIAGATFGQKKFKKLVRMLQPFLIGLS